MDQNNVEVRGLAAEIYLFISSCCQIEHYDFDV